MSNAKKGKYIGNDRFKYWKGKPSPLKGKKMSKESRKNMSNSAKRRIQNIGPPNCKPINIFLIIINIIFLQLMKHMFFVKVII